MEIPEPEAIGSWLEKVQRYSVTADTARRMSDVLAGVMRTEANVIQEPLFWTEPANLVSVMSARGGTGDDND